MEPIFVLDIMDRLDAELIQLLRTLSADEWSAQTIAPKWKVKDVAVHLLDGNLRALSMLRDQYFGVQPAAEEPLLDFLNRLNAEWVLGMKRLSPRVITDLLESSGREYRAFLRSLPPNEPAVFSVAWAGETESNNWFHIAREYTEKWHHQQQIRLAVGTEALLYTDEFYLPHLETSMRALPYHYRQLPGQENDLIEIVVRGNSLKSWYLQWQNGSWQLLTESEQQPSCRITIPDAYAWRILTKGIDRAAAVQYSDISGDQTLGLHFFSMLAVMA